MKVNFVAFQPLRRESTLSNVNQRHQQILSGLCNPKIDENAS